MVTSENTKTITNVELTIEEIEDKYKIIFLNRNDEILHLLIDLIRGEIVFDTFDIDYSLPNSQHLILRKKEQN